MNISYNWLQSLLHLPESPEEIGKLLTATGLEVEGIEQVVTANFRFSNVVIGEVLTAEQHPNADRLRVCTVSVGNETPLNIVCGAPNVAAGQRVAVALEGAVLNPTGSTEPLKIKKGKIRGAESQGMICAEDELGLGQSHDGILVFSDDAPIGMSLEKYLTKDADTKLEIGLTPNRVDAASHLGVVRDLAAVLKRKIQRPIGLNPQNLTTPNPISIQIEDAERCPRYTGIHIANVKVAESPAWLQARLSAIGLRPINNIVDITNYVLMELGHPLHAFDADKLQGSRIVVRTLPESQEFVTLDGKSRNLLPATDLMICDAQKPLAIAGVLGGLDSGVTEETQNIFLESAYFQSTTIRKTAKRLTISTDASFRYERGTDPNITVEAALRAVALIVEIAGGTPSAITDIKLADFPPREIHLSIPKAHTLIGKNIPVAEIIEILERLEIQVTQNGDVLELKVPTYRVDVQGEQDVIEDILRIYGYDNIDFPGKIAFTPHGAGHSSEYSLREKICNLLSASGLYEMWNNSLIHKRFSTENSVEILNPLSEELSIMRPSLLWNGLEVIQFNQNRQHDALGLYELGKVYSQKINEEGKKKYIETEQIAIFLTGAQAPLHWERKSIPTTLSTLRKYAQQLAQALGLQGELRETTHPEMDYGVEFVFKKQVLMTYGKVKQSYQTQFDLRNEVFYLVGDWAKMTKSFANQTILYHPIPLYPGIRRDISMLIDEQTQYEQIRIAVQKISPQLIQSIDLHDVYKGKNTPEGKKSYLISLFLQDETTTMEDTVADKIMEKATKTLVNVFGAEIRKG